jgi:catechol 2,3-dioxygenase-like lactoylglutathione lyase family enzyme
MPTRLVHVVADAHDPARLARFWAALLGWQIADETGEEVDVWPAGYSYPDPVAVPIVFVPVPEPKTARTGSISTWPAGQPRIRPDWSAGPGTWAAGQWTSARATCRGW